MDQYRLPTNDYNVTNDPKVRFELEEGDTSSYVTNCIEILVEHYEAVVSLLSTLGFTVGPWISNQE